MSNPRFNNHPVSALQALCWSCLGLVSVGLTISLIIQLVPSFPVRPLPVHPAFPPLSPSLLARFVLSHYAPNEAGTAPGLRSLSLSLSLSQPQSLPPDQRWAIRLVHPERTLHHALLPPFKSGRGWGRRLRRRRGRRRGQRGQRGRRGLSVVTSDANR